jgi:hypothetical protein
MFMNAVFVCPPSNTKFCCCVIIPEPFEYVGVRPVIVKPASAIGGLLLEVISSVYVVREVEDVEEEMVGARRSIWFEYDAADCHVEIVAVDNGHMPPKT